MSEDEITSVTIQMKLDALERVLTPAQLEAYREILAIKKENFVRVWGSHLSKEQLEEALVDFDV